jgi:hypothetical protein
MSEELKLRVVEKTMKVKEPLPDRLYTALIEYKNKWRDLPDGLLVGPNEWLEFKHGIMCGPMFFTREESQPKFHGVPIYRMTRPGVDVMPGENITPYLAMGSVKEKDL